MNSFKSSSSCRREKEKRGKGNGKQKTLIQATDGKHGLLYWEYFSEFSPY